MIHAHAYREVLGPGNPKVPGKQFPWLSLAAVPRICSESKAQIPGEVTGPFLPQKVLDLWLVQKGMLTKCVGAFREQ